MKDITYILLLTALVLAVIGDCTAHCNNVDTYRERQDKKKACYDLEQLTYDNSRSESFRKAAYDKYLERCL